MKKLSQILAVSAVLAGVLVGSVQAAGIASFSLSPASGSYTVGNSFSVGVFENGTDVNVVTAKLTYDASKLTCNGVGASAAFPNTITAACSGGSVTISRYTSPGTTVTGAQSVGSISFTAAAAGTVAVNFAAGSQIASAGVDTWNGSTAGGSYTISNAAPAPVSGGSTGSGSGTSKTTTTKTVAAGAVTHTATSGTTSATDTATGTNPADSTSNVKAASVSTVNKTVQAETAATEQSNTVAWVIAGLLILGLAILAFLRRHQIGAWVTNMRKKSVTSPAPKATKTAASKVSRKTTAKRVSKK